MSKHCEVCKSSYSDQLDACPHCAEADEIAEADVVELAEDVPEVVVEGAASAHAAAPSDSAIDLSLPTMQVDGSGSGARSGDASGLSFVEWASLVEEGPAHVEPAAAQFDDPADADLISRLHDPRPETADPVVAMHDPLPETADPVAATHDPLPAMAEDDDIHSTLGALPVEPAPAVAHDDEDALSADLEAVRTIFSGDASASFVRRGPAQPAAQPPADDDDSALNLLAPGVGDSALAEATPVSAQADSAIELTADDDSAGHPIEPAAADAVDSGIDLVATDLVEEAAPSVEVPTAEGADSGIDLTALMADDAPASDVVVAREDSGIDLGAAQLVTGASGSALSSVHLVDSALNLGAEALAGDQATPPPAAGEAVVRPISDAGIDLSGAEASGVGLDSGPQAGIEQNSPGTSESGRDLIAEQVESGMNLPLETFEVVSESKIGLGSDAVAEIVADDSGETLAAGQLASEDEEVDLTEMPAVDVVDSSAVDLGASASFPVAPPEPASEQGDEESTRPYEVKAKSIHGAHEVAPSEVDLGARHGKPAGGSSAADFFEESGALADAPPVDMTEDEEIDLTGNERPTAAEEVELEASDTDSPAVESEEEELTEEEAPARTARAPKEKRPSTAGAWLGGALIGAVVGAGACVLLWLFTGGSSPVVANPNGTGPAAAVPLSFAEKAALVRAGELERAQKAGIENVDESKPEEVAMRGEFRVRNYLMQQTVNKQPIKLDDESMKKGLDDLDKVKGQNADAAFYLGVAREAAGDAAGAQKVYLEGQEHFKDDARFTDALTRLALKAGAKPIGRAFPPAIDMAALALLLTALEDDSTPPAPAPGEAGSVFWKAVKLARDQQYADAVKALDQAAETHTKRRFVVLGKAQNPNSDPTEEIFLRSCEELKAYWQLQDKLHASLLTDVKGKDAAAAVDALLADADKLDKTTKDADTLKKDLETAKKDAEDAKKETETTKKDLDTAKKDLEATKKDLDTAKDDLEAKKKDLVAAVVKAVELTLDVKTAKVEAGKKGDTVKAVAAALASANFIKPNADDAAVVQGAKDLVQSADVQAAGKLIGALKGEAADLKAEAAGLQDVLKQRWEPEQMLTFWLPLLRERGRKDLANDAIIDADRVLKADKGSSAVKAHAHAVKGVALRDQEKYPEAAKELEQAKADLPKEDGEWLLETEAALMEASDPSAYFAARARVFHREGRMAQALAMLDRALETAAPGAKGQLLVEHGTWRLDEALVRGKGQIRADDPEVAAAQKNADEAKKDGLAEAFYLSGRIAETLGQADVAMDEYRQALKVHGALDSDGARYRAALARMLVRQGRASDGGKVGRNDGAPPLDVVIALIAIGLQPGDLGGQTDAATKEAVRLADEILSAKPEDVPFEARAQAYAVKGQWTQALRIYAEGLRNHRLLDPEHAVGLMAIIQSHPSLRRPTRMTLADPLEAEKHYAAGLHWYNDRQYGKAEEEFFTAVEHDGQDARYYYFLGLAQLMQGDRDAYEEFEQGARLEQQHRPPRAAVNAALERVQGPPREKLNDIRDRPR